MHIASQQSVDDLPHRQHDPTYQHEAHAQLEGAPRYGFLIARGEEQTVLEMFDFVVEGLHRGEVSVDDVVQQAVDEERHPVLGQIDVGVPAADDGLDVESLVLADGDQRVRSEERCDSLIVSSAVTGSNKIP